MADKLHIPGPHQTDDVAEIDITIVITWAICTLLCMAIVFNFLAEGGAEQERDEESEARTGDDEESSRDRFARMSDDELESLEWTDRRLARVFEDGPREASEIACFDVRDRLTAGDLGGDAYRVLEESATVGSRHTPWACLLTLAFDGELSEQEGLAGAVEEYWAAVERFEYGARPVVTTLTHLRRHGAEIDSPRFASWLRLCAMRGVDQESEECYRFVRERPAVHGSDPLIMVEHHFEAHSPREIARHIRIIIHHLGELAADGAPDEWPLAEDAPVDGDDLRIAASFQLCRILNSPNEPAADAARQELGHAANRGARGTDPSGLKRWRHTCRLAFGSSDESEDDEAKESDGDRRDSDEPGSARALAVWSGDENDAPDYTFASVIERDDCPEPPDDHPAWSCALELWRGGHDESLQRSLAGFFTETRDLSWYDE